MEQEKKTVSIGVDAKLGLLSDIIGEEVSPVAEWQVGKLVLWYGGEWVQYDEYSEDTNLHSRYTAGAYMQTIALNPSVITEPKYIADAALRINQQFDDAKFIERFLVGLYEGQVILESEEEACATLCLAGDYGKAGHWPSGFDWETGDITWQMQPEHLGAAVAAFVKPEWIGPIYHRMLDSQK